MNLLDTKTLSILLALVATALASPITPRQNPVSNILIPSGCSPTPSNQGKCTLLTLTFSPTTASAWMLNNNCDLIAYESRVKVGVTTELKQVLGPKVEVTIGDKGREFEFISNGFRMDTQSSRRFCKEDGNRELLCAFEWSCGGAAKPERPPGSGYWG